MNGSSFHRPTGPLAHLAGKSIRGGCEDCSAVQEVDLISPGVYGLTVRHDHTCPTYRAMVARRDKENQ